MQDNPVVARVLDNGLTLEIFDHSQAVLGDRWSVRLAARVKVPVDGLPASDKGPPVNRDDLAAMLGDEATFEQKRQRNFVDIRERDRVFQELLDSFLTSLLDYLSHPQFAQRFLRQALAAERQRRRLAAVWPPDSGGGA
jgi:hypothetical protein